MEQIGMNRKNILVSLILCILSVILVRYLSYTGGSIATVIVGIYFLTISEIDRYVLLIMFLPIAAVFKIGESLPSSMVILYIIIILSYLFKHKISKTLLIMLILISMQQLCTVITFGSSITSIVSFIINLFVSGVLLRFFTSENTDEKKKEIFNSVSIGFALSMIMEILLAIIFPDLTYMIHYRKAVALAYQHRFCALNVDPNYFSQLVLIAIALLIAYLHRNKNITTRKKIICIITIGFLGYYGYLGYSKSYIIALSILIVLVCLSFYMTKRFRLYKLFIGVLILALVGFGAGQFYSKVIMNVFAVRENSAGVLTGRDVIWSEYLSLFSERPLTWIGGMGSSNGMNIIESGAVAHNAYIEILGDLGIIGIVLLSVFYISNGLKIKLNPFNLDYLFVIMFLIMSFSLSLSSYDAIYLIIPLTACVGVSGGIKNE